MKEDKTTTDKINENLAKGLRLKEFYERKGLSQESFAEKIGASQQYISAVVNGKRNLGPNILNRITSNFSDFSELYFRTGETEEELVARLGGKSLDVSNLQSNGRLMEKQFSKMLIKLPVKAQLGLMEAEFPEIYIDQLEKYEVQTEENWNGRYFDIECYGESMVCDDPQRAIFPGDEIRVREIRWDLYANSKLHIHDYPEFAFFHRTKGICVKHVLEHNVMERKVLLHSYNPDKDKYPDEWISLNDCYIVANVVSVTKDRGFRRKIKKLGGV
ncbi:helix-turn-helix domain-containing protein [Cruoricaptor ignavus]|uniref:helix-turn-helix domain-containing protein n=1 Tax=Cruoricaptor ignavus TaxID=1118202 RepID=UPI00370D8431